MTKAPLVLRALLPALFLFAAASGRPLFALEEKPAHDDKAVHEEAPAHEVKAAHEEHPAHVEERVSPSSPANTRAALQQLMDGNRRFTLRRDAAPR